MPDAPSYRLEPATVSYIDIGSPRKRTSASHALSGHPRFKHAVPRSLNHAPHSLTRIVALIRLLFPFFTSLFFPFITMSAPALEDPEKLADASGETAAVAAAAAAAASESAVSDELTAAPPQPPLETTDGSSIQLPEIVHGIDPTDDTSSADIESDAANSSRSNSQNAPVRRIPSTAIPPVTDMLSTISARVQRVVRLANAPPPPPPPPGLVLFGDSLTEHSQSASDPTTAPGWSTLLQEAYRSNVNVFVRGFSGYNTRWALHIFPRVLRSCLRAGANVVAVTILLGTNDSFVPSSQHVPVHEYTDNLTKLVEFVRSLNIIPILMTPPPACAPDRPPDLTARYAQACRSVAPSSKCPLIDLHAGFLARAGPDGLEAMFVDGVHFSSEGNRTLFDLVYAALPTIVPELNPDSFVKPFPSYDTINIEDATLSLGTSELVEP